MEIELKKDIKKLQKSREQIRLWLSNNDIKDKDSLNEMRKQIEAVFIDFFKSLYRLSRH